MESCKYQQVNNKEVKESNSENFSWTPFLRQLLVCCGLWTTYFVTGLTLGSPTVVIPQLRREANYTAGAAVTDEMASWMSSALSYSGMPSAVILPILCRTVGRRPPFIIAITTSVASFIIFYVGTTTTTFLISQAIQGILFGSNLTVSIIMVTEYTSPQYRGMFLTIKSASLFWGVWASNAIGTFFQWNYIGLFGLVCSSYYVTVFFWPESPHWLATKGRFEECIKAHQWLKGTSLNAEKELEDLIKSQKEYLLTCKEENLRERMISFYKMLVCQEFYKPILLSLLLMAHYHALGKIVCSMYSIELIRRITESESTSYIGMLILDGVSVFGMYIGCALSKIVKRRNLLFFASALGIFFLFAMSLYLWLVKLSIILENKTVTLGLLAAFSLAISVGPMVMSTSIYGELIPLRYKTSAVIIIVFIHFTLLGSSLKIAPLIFRTFDLYGTFFFYGLLSTILSVVLYMFLPETKDKTLLEIENYFKEDSKEITNLIQVRQ